MLDKRYNSAISELTVFIQKRCLQLSLDGWSFHTTEDAPESFKELLTYKDSKIIPIASYGSENTIYKHEAINTLFRFWHDVLHLVHNKGFTLEDELYIASVHVDEAVKELSVDALNILWADTAGQIKYYYRWKQFVTYQEAFVREYIKSGDKTLITKFH